MTDGDDETVGVSARMPRSLRDGAKANAERGELSEAVRAAYRAVRYGTTPADEVERSALHDRREQLQKQRAEAASELESIGERLAELEERRRAASDREEEYEDMLARIEQDVRDGMAVFPGHGTIQSAAETRGKAPQGVIEDLRERNPDLPDRAFRDQMHVDECWEGVQETHE